MIEIGRKEAVFFSVVVALMLVAFGVTAYDSDMAAGDPIVMGHSGGELHVEWGGVTDNLTNALGDSYARIVALETFDSDQKNAWVVGFDCDVNGDCSAPIGAAQVCNMKFPGQGYVPASVDCASFEGVISHGEGIWLASGSLRWCADDDTPAIDLTVTCVDSDGSTKS